MTPPGGAAPPVGSGATAPALSFTAVLAVVTAAASAVARIGYEDFY